MRITPGLVVLSVAALVAGSSACGSSNDDPPRAASTSQTPTTRAVTTTTEEPGMTVNWRNDAPPIAIGTPFCDAANRCLVPATERGTAHGDLEGTFIAAGAAAPNESGTRFVGSRTDVFTGTVRACGEGTLVFLVTEDATPNSGSGTWTIAPGYGTGDLRGASGHGTGTGTADGSGIHSTLTGTIICNS
jgi:hypothetical protein